MKVILLKDVPKLGRKYEVKDVASGHALNYLVPRGEAAQATPAAMKRFKAEQARAEGERKVREDLMVKNIQDLDGVTVKISEKANEKGHLFAGLHREEIAAEVQRQTELQVDPSFLQMEHPIKEIGEHLIEVRAGGKSAKLKVAVEAK